MPRGHIYIEVGKELKIDQMTEEQQKEVRLRHRWTEAMKNCEMKRTSFYKLVKELN